MADPKAKMSPRTKKVIVYSGMGAAAVGAFFLMTAQAPKVEPRREPEQTGLLGGADTRTAGLEGLSRRLQEVEAQVDQRSADPATTQQLNELSSTATRLQATLERQDALILDLQKQLADAKKAASVVVAPVAENGASTAAPGASATTDPAAAGSKTAAVMAEAAGANPGTTGLPSTPESRAEYRRRLVDGMNLAGEEVYAQPVETLYAIPPVVAATTPITPKIVSHEPVRPPPVAPATPTPAPAAAAEAAEIADAEPEDPMELIPDLRIAAGSVMSAFLLTGLDAPTGSKADANPIPVLMRIKLEARMPNYAYADVMDCHLIGAAYGDLASERVNIRGEKVSCTLHNGQVFDGSTKFFVTGEDGKNGIRGRLVNRSGKMLARTAYASIAQGITGVLASKAGGTTVNLGGAGGTAGTGENVSLGTAFGSNAATTAGQGFQRLGDYYMNLAEQTFPVIEISNGRWVDVVLTDTMEVKFLRGSPYAAAGGMGVALK